MLNLTQNDKYYLTELIGGDNFDSLDSYLSISSEADIYRLLTTPIVYVLRTWDTYLDLRMLGHRENYPILFYDTLYRQIGEFNYTSVFGEESEHIEWLNSRENGEQIYLSISGVDFDKCILCLVVTTPSIKLKKEVIQQWLDKIKWDVYSYTANEIILHYVGVHELVIYYLPSAFSHEISKIDIINSPSTITVGPKIIKDSIMFFEFREGYYLFKELINGGIDKGGSEQWLRIEQPTGDLATNYTYINTINYLGSRQVIQILLNIQENPVYNQNPPASNFRFIGNLIPEV